MPSARAVRCTSVVDPPHEPALAQRVVINPVASTLLSNPLGTGPGFRVLRGKGPEAHLQVPFVVVPRIFSPPISGSPPWTRCRQYFSPLALENQPRWSPVAQFQLGGKCRAKNSEASRGGTGKIPRSGASHGMSGNFRARHKAPHLKFSRSVGIEQCGSSHIFLAHHVSDPRDGQR